MLEVLAALVLLSLLFLLLTSGLQFGTRAWNTGQEKLSSNAEALTVQQLLRGVLSEARPYIIEGTPAVRRHVFFAGNQNSLQFIAPLPEHLGNLGLYEVALYLTDQGGSDNHLEMSWHLFREAETSASSQRQERKVALLDKVTQIQFAYFGQRSAQDPAQWYNDWRAVQSLPRLIRMHVTLSTGEEAWPDLVVATKVQSLSLINDPENLD